MNDPTDYAGHVRLEKWDEDQYYRSAKDDAICESLRPFEKYVRGEKKKDDTPEYAAFLKFLADNPEAKAAVETGAAATFFERKARDPSVTYADASHVYKKVPWNDQPFLGDMLQFGFDLVDGYEHHKMKLDTDRVPEGFHAMPDTDYEFSLYACTDGGSELWRLLAPGIPRGHHYPRQPRAKLDQGPVKSGKHVVKRDGHVTIYESRSPGPISAASRQTLRLYVASQQQPGPRCRLRRGQKRDQEQRPFA